MILSTVLQIVFLSSFQGYALQTPPTAKAPRVQKSIARKLTGDQAIIVGVNKYGRLGGGESLPGAKNDAEAMDKLLVEKGFETRLLVGPQATKQGIQDAFEQVKAYFRKPGKDKARFVFYFAGHGRRNPKYVFLPYDARKITEERPDENSLDSEWLRRQMKSINTPNCTIILDSCFAGGIIQEVGKESETANLGTKPSNKEQGSSPTRPTGSQTSTVDLKRRGRGYNVIEDGVVLTKGGDPYQIVSEEELAKFADSKVALVAAASGAEEAGEGKLDKLGTPRGFFSYYFEKELRGLSLDGDELPSWSDLITRIRTMFAKVSIKQSPIVKDPFQNKPVLSKGGASPQVQIAKKLSDVVSLYAPDNSVMQMKIVPELALPNASANRTYLSIGENFDISVTLSQPGYLFVIFHDNEDYRMYPNGVDVESASVQPCKEGFVHVKSGKLSLKPVKPTSMDKFNFFRSGSQQLKIVFTPQKEVAQEILSLYRAISDGGKRSVSYKELSEDSRGFDSAVEAYESVYTSDLNPQVTRTLIGNIAYRDSQLPLLRSGILAPTDVLSSHVLEKLLATSERQEGSAMPPIYMFNSNPPLEDLDSSEREDLFMHWLNRMTFQQKLWDSKLYLTDSRFVQLKSTAEKVNPGVDTVLLNSYILYMMYPDRFIFSPEDTPYFRYGVNP